jgi:hypothetical protein
MTQLWKKLWRNTLWSNERGAAFPLIGLGLMMMVAATGTAIDMGRLQIVQSRMSSALDNAGLAAGAVANSGDINAQASRYFYANFPVGYMGSTISSLTATPNGMNTILTLQVSGTVPTTFMRVFGVSSLPIGARSEITLSNKGMELVMVLDITGSMWTNNNHLNLREASTDLINILYSDRETVENLWVSVVPYVTAVNIGNHRTSWLTSYNSSLYPSNYPTSAVYPPANLPWKGCVEERASPLDVDDTPPSATDASSRFPMYFWPDTVSTQDNNWISDTNSSITIRETVNYADTGSNSGLGPNISCGEQLLPFTSSKTTVLNKLNSLYPWRKSGTASSTGVAWGWRVMSPRWRGLWDHELVNGQVKLPHNYNEPLITKVMVIETDGSNTLFDSIATDPFYSDYGGYKRLNTTAGGGRSDFNTQNQNTAVTIINNKTLAICNAMKAQGVLIYTITFRLGSSSADNAARTMWRACASKPEYYFDAESQVSGASSPNLQNAFRQIGDSLANLRISK